MDPARCPNCGSDALVTVLSDDGSGGKQLRRSCPDCRARDADRSRAELRRVQAGLAKLLVTAGALLALLTATADNLAISGRAGFGWRQITGVELGFLAMVLGLFLRQALLGVAGLFLFLLSIGADLLQVGHVPGLGWRSHLGFVVATAMLAAGIAWHRALARRSAQRDR